MFFLDSAPIWLFILIMAVHWFADFICQNDWMAHNKANNPLILGAHILCYSAVLMLFFGPIYAIVNGILHYITDFFSSKATKYFYNKGDNHNFFVVIGFDQLVHAVCLFSTIGLICWR